MIAKIISAIAPIIAKLIVLPIHCNLVFCRTHDLILSNGQRPTVDILGRLYQTYGCDSKSYVLAIFNVDSKIK